MSHFLGYSAAQTLPEIVMLSPLLRGRDVVNQLALAGNSQGQAAWSHFTGDLGTSFSLPQLRVENTFVCLGKRAGEGSR